MATSKDTTALKVNYKSPLSINQRQVEKAIEIMRQQAMPHDFKAEESVLGAILLTNVDEEGATQESRDIYARVVKVRNMLKTKDFYEEKNQVVFEAVTHLVDKKKAVDLVTVMDEIRRMGKSEVVPPFELVEITRAIGSSVHAIEHARIVLDLSLRRQAILANHLANTRLYDLSYDVFETRNELADDLRVMPLTSFLRARTANQRTEDGKNMPRVKQMCGSLWKKGELVFLFAGPKRGKSIFAVQIADALSKGDPLLNGVLHNECDPQRVGYIDFELMDNEWYSRYADEKTDFSYDFNENFIIIDQNPDFTDYDNGMDKVIFASIEEAVLSHKLDAVIIDNITWLAQVATSDTQAALELMKKLDQLKKRTGISLLILAHSPKINAVLPLDENMMGGSKHLSNFAQGVFAIGKSVIGKETRYIKECVRRNGRLHFDDENVIQVEIVKEKSLLQYQFVQLNHEATHLSDPNDADTKLMMVKQGAEMRKTTTKSFKEIYDDLAIKDAIGWSERQFRRKVKEELERMNEILLVKDETQNSEEEAPHVETVTISAKADTATVVPF